MLEEVETMKQNGIWEGVEHLPTDGTVAVENILVPKWIRNEDCEL